MRAAVLLLVCASLAGCVRLQAVEGELTKAPPAGGRSSGTSTGEGTQHQALTSHSDVTPAELAGALKQKGVDVDLRPLSGYDRNGAVAALLIARDPNASEPPKLLVYACTTEEMARELVGLMGGDGFAAGRFAIGPAVRNPDNQALARTIRKALD